MTCYFRHLKEAFDEVGIEVAKDNKRDIDRIIHEIVGANYENCSATWKKVKERLVDDRDGFVAELKQAIH